ncbi:MAG: hypothetical protein SPG83_01125, partial [Intestinimonas sp.]|uniref:hypothetical protein n=1 Tax=Intestinimonas sp. TaxID=1965293 RepID=UPI002A90920A
TFLFDGPSMPIPHPVYQHRPVSFRITGRRKTLFGSDFLRAAVATKPDFSALASAPSGKQFEAN